MSKVGITLGVIVLGSGTSLTGAYLLGAFDPDYELPIEKFEDNKESDIRTAIKNEGCVQSMFSGIENLSATTDIATSDLSSSFFSTDAQSTKEGCLVVNWDKGTESGKVEWQGNFRFLWAMREHKEGSSKGFIVFATGDTVVDGGAHKIQFKASAYTIKIKDGVWTVDKKKEKFTSGEKKLEKDKFPKANSDLEKMNNKSYGGLTEDNKGDQLQNLDDTKRKGESTDKFRGYGIGENDTNGKKKATDWTSNWSDWCNEVFENNSLKIILGK